MEVVEGGTKLLAERTDFRDEDVAVEDVTCSAPFPPFLEVGIGGAEADVVVLLAEVLFQGRDPGPVDGGGVGGFREVAVVVAGVGGREDARWWQAPRGARRKPTR